jgi:hypothetical protein
MRKRPPKCGALTIASASIELASWAMTLAVPSRGTSVVATVSGLGKPVTGVPLAVRSGTGGTVFTMRKVPSRRITTRKIDGE